MADDFLGSVVAIVAVVFVLFVAFSLRFEGFCVTGRFDRSGQ